MQRLKPALYRAVQPLRHFLGYDLINRNKFGYDAFLDIQRLSKAWGLSVECFFDVGANDGNSSALAFAYFPQTRVFAFEPHPDTFERLTQRMIKHPRFHAFNVALGSKVEEATLFEYGSSDFSSLVPNAACVVRFEREKKRVIPVSCTTIDGFCAAQRLDRIDVLKVDTEGFDSEVIRGAVKLMSAGSIRFIYFEFNEIISSEGIFGGALGPIAEFIGAHGYRFIATYNDYLVYEGKMFGVSNALFALPSRPEV
jgi:FkbM family methyltransferase